MGKRDKEGKRVRKKEGGRWAVLCIVVNVTTRYYSKRVTGTYKSPLLTEEIFLTSCS